MAGFLDDNIGALSGYDHRLPVVGTIRGYDPDPSDALVMAIGVPQVKLKVARSLIERGAAFLTVIHPTAMVGERVSLGDGCVVCPNVVITCDVHIGAFVTLNVKATVGHDARIGDGCTLSGHADVTGCARLGEGVFLGSHASVLPGVQVGDFATVGAGSVVVKRVKAEQTVIGVPAKALRL